MRRTIAAIGIAVGMICPTPAIAHAEPVDCATDLYAFEVGDDDCDGDINEDESGWDCATMGNRVCGLDVTYCPADGVWSATWHWCPPLAGYVYDLGAYVGGYN